MEKEIFQSKFTGQEIDDILTKADVGVEINTENPPSLMEQATHITTQDGETYNIVELNEGAENAYVYWDSGEQKLRTMFSSQIDDAVIIGSGTIISHLLEGITPTVGCDIDSEDTTGGTIIQAITKVYSPLEFVFGTSLVATIMDVRINTQTMAIVGSPYLEQCYIGINLNASLGINGVHLQTELRQIDEPDIEIGTGQSHEALLQNGGLRTELGENIVHYAFVSIRKQTLPYPQASN